MFCWRSPLTADDHCHGLLVAVEKAIGVTAKLTLKQWICFGVSLGAISPRDNLRVNARSENLRTVLLKKEKGFAAQTASCRLHNCLMCAYSSNGLDFAGNLKETAHHWSNSMLHLAAPSKTICN
jgi:hypothetical protein